MFDSFFSIVLHASWIFELYQDGRFFLATVNNTLLNQVVLEVLLALPNAFCIDEGRDKELTSLTCGYRRSGSSSIIDHRLEYYTVFHVCWNYSLSFYWFQLSGHRWPVMPCEHRRDLVQKAWGKWAFLTSHHESLLYYRCATSSAFSHSAIIGLSVSCCFDSILRLVHIHQTCWGTCLLPLLLLMGIYSR